MGQVLTQAIGRSKNNLKSLLNRSSMINLKRSDLEDCFRIRDHAFYYNTQLQSIELPKGLAGIEEEVFAGCNRLEKIVIPSSITYIRTGAFSGVNKLTEVIYEGSLDSWNNIHKDTNWDQGSNISSVITFSEPTSVDNLRYEYDSETDSYSILGLAQDVVLDKLIIPTTINNSYVRTIVRGAFRDNQDLKEVVLPSSLRTIGKNAFYNCDNLISIYIPNGVETIENSAFPDSKLIYLVIPDSVVNDNLYRVAGDSYSALKYFKDSRNRDNTQSAIDFSQTSKLVYLDLPYLNVSFTTSSRQTPQPYSRLSSLWYSSDYSKSVRKLIIEGTTESKSYTYSDLTGYYYKGHIRGRESSDPCIPNNIRSIKFGEGITHIDEYTFDTSQSALAYIEVSPNIKSVHNSVWNIRNLIRFKDYSGGGIYLGSEEKPYNILIGLINPQASEFYMHPDCCYLADNTLFQNNSYLQEIYCSLSILPDNLFLNCTNLRKFHSSSSTGLKQIGNNCFKNCTSLSRITCQSSSDEGLGIETIGDNAFENCYVLQGVSIGSNIKHIGTNAFLNCNNFTYDYDGQFKYLANSNSPYRVLISAGNTGNINSNCLVIYDNAYNGCTNSEIIIPDTVRSVSSLAFNGYAGTLTALSANSDIADKLQNLTTLYSSQLHLTITSGKVRARAFSYNSKIYYLTIGSGVTELGSDCFRVCSNLQSVILEEGLQTIQADAFTGCSQLQSLYIPASVSSITPSIIYGSSNITSLQVADNNTTFRSVDNCIIDRATNTIILACKTSIIPTDGSVTAIGKRAFGGCSGLTSISIPSTITTLGQYAFEGTGLQSIVLPSSVTSLGYGIFNACNSLVSADISAVNMTSSVNIFPQSAAFTTVYLPTTLTYLERSFIPGTITDIYYNDTISNWNNITKQDRWDSGASSYTIHCSDGDITK